MNILVTGASGFVGSRLCSMLSSSTQYNVYELQKSQEYNIKQNTIYADLSQPNWHNLLPTQIEIIVHLAQSKHYREFPDKAEDIFNINIKSTFHLLEWARANRVKKFIFSSTGSVYSLQNNMLSENSPCDPINMYAASKLCCEHLIKQYANYFNVSILRLFSIYGPRQKGMLIPSIIDKIKNNETITLVNNEGLFLTPLYIDDCIKMIVAIMDIPHDMGLTIVNMSGDEIISLSNAVSTISTLLCIEPKVQIIEGSTPWVCGSNNKIKNLLGFGPTVCFNDGIRNILNNGIV